MLLHSKESMSTQIPVSSFDLSQPVCFQFPFFREMLQGACFYCCDLFPVRAVAQGSLCVRFPYHRGWSSRDSADFRCTKTMLKFVFLEKMPAQIKKNGAQKSSSPRTKSLCGAEISKNANMSNNGFSNMQIIEKYNGPRTTCFLDPGATSAIEIGGEKGDQTKDWPKLAYHYFAVFGKAQFVRTTVFAMSGKA